MSTLTIQASDRGTVRLLASCFGPLHDAATPQRWQIALGPDSVLRAVDAIAGERARAAKPAPARWLLGQIEPGADLAPLVAGTAAQREGDGALEALIFIPTTSPTDRPDAKSREASEPIASLLTSLEGTPGLERVWVAALEPARHGLLLESLLTSALAGRLDALAGQSAGGGLHWLGVAGWAFPRRRAAAWTARALALQWVEAWSASSAAPAFEAEAWLERHGAAAEPALEGDLAVWIDAPRPGAIDAADQRLARLMAALGCAPSVATGSLRTLIQRHRRQLSELRLCLAQARCLLEDETPWQPAPSRPPASGPTAPASRPRREELMDACAALGDAALDALADWLHAPIELRLTELSLSGLRPSAWLGSPLATTALASAFRSRAERVAEPILGLSIEDLLSELCPDRAALARAATDLAQASLPRAWSHLVPGLRTRLEGGRSQLLLAPSGTDSPLAAAAPGLWTDTVRHGDTRRLAALSCLRPSEPALVAALLEASRISPRG